MFLIDNETLEKGEGIKPGDFIKCPHCKKGHWITGCDDGSTVLLFYKCGGESYLAGIAGKSILDRRVRD